MLGDAWANQRQRRPYASMSDNRTFKANNFGANFATTCVSPKIADYIFKSDALALTNVKSFLKQHEASLAAPFRLNNR